MDPVKNILGKKFVCEKCEGEGGRIVKSSPYGYWEVCENCGGKGYA